VSSDVVLEPTVLDNAVLTVERSYRLHPRVAVRPEPFGALVYHYGNRKLVFLKSPRMVEVVTSLDQHGSVAATLAAHGVPDASLPRYVAALQSLLRSDMIIPIQTVEG
jgi:putative mycofactocin binding protein MftB